MTVSPREKALRWWQSETITLSDVALDEFERLYTIEAVAQEYVKGRATFEGLIQALGKKLI